MRRLELAGAWVLSIGPFIGLTAALLDVQSLAGVSSAGLPYIAPAAACFACLWLGWWTFPATEALWRAVSWASLLGASLLSRTPLWLALDWHFPRVETWPLLAVSAYLALRGWVAMASRFGAYQLVGFAVMAVLPLAVVLPWISALVTRWPSAVIALGYGSLVLFLFSAAYAYHLERKRDVSTQ